MAEFYKSVPETMAENLAYRLALRKRAEKDIGFQRAMSSACKHDVLFFFSAWCWLYEPRPRLGRDGRCLPKQIPFIPWEHQLPVILDIRKYLGYKDIGIEKSRGEGMSWIGVLMALHDWLFDDMAKIGLVSNTEKKADDPGNMDSLMAKIDWELTRLPRWMAGIKDIDWTRNLSDHSLVNLRNLSQINAFAATADAGRAGRYKWFMPDELAFWDRGKDDDFINSIRGSTDSRLVISTPCGNEGAYYKFMHTPSNAIRMRLHWSENSSKNRGMYRLECGKPVAVDPVNNPLHHDYDPVTQEVLDLWSRLRTKGFKIEGRLRSPWYDNECDRADATPVNIAQELDLDYGGSMLRFFGSSDFIDKASAKVMSPLLRGVLDFHPETLVPKFDKAEDGPFLLWTQLDNEWNPPHHSYVVCADISSGLGGSHTSNSVAHVIDLVTMEQVLEYATNTEPPEEFADTCIALSLWFYDALLAWEANYGSGFAKRVKDFRYTNIYMREQFWKSGRNRTKEPGFWTDDKTKPAMLSELRRSIRQGDFIIHSEALAKEFGQYVMINGKIEHVGAVSTDDESSKGKAHGDRVMSIGVGLIAARTQPHSREAAKIHQEQNMFGGSMAKRMREREQLENESQDDWDNRDNDDLARGRGWTGKIAIEW